MRPRRKTFPAGLLVLAALLTSTTARAQDPSNPEELRKLYHEAIAQLKASQDRKNELAEENERLKARIVELEQQTADQSRAAVEWSARTWFYRSHFAAWQRFVELHPQLKQRWKAFLVADVFDPFDPIGDNWAPDGAN